MAEAPPARKRSLRLRPWVRALHRDFGYLVVGLTFVYAISGLAVNHIADWDPNFVSYARQHQLDRPVPDDDEAAAALVLRHAGIEETPLDVYRPGDGTLEIALEEQTLHVVLETGVIFEEGQRQRPFLRTANWLHLNRGKKAWTWFADAYAIVLLFLATSGLFMLPGKKGLLGRGAVLVSAGIAIPLAYLAWFGSP
jgi:uncharacterized protein